MEPQVASTEILHDFTPRILIYKDGRVERLRKDVIVPPSYDAVKSVHSKDFQITPGASVRVYRPDHIPDNTKLPVLIYYHGGAYCQYSAFSSMYHTYLNSLVNEARVIAVSADYRLAPESPIPACYDDTWDIIKWVLSHSAGSGPDPWISQWADMGRIFLAGDSGGANMSHNMLAQAGVAGLLSSPATKVEGVVLVHPFFAHGELEDIVDFLSEGKMGVLHPIFNPMTDPARMKREVVCERMLVCVDKDDAIRERGILYHNALKESGWEGELQLLETNGGGHVFHLWDPTVPKAHEFLKVIASFINKNGVN